MRTDVDCFVGDERVTVRRGTHHDIVRFGNITLYFEENGLSNLAAAIAAHLANAENWDAERADAEAL